PLRDVLEADREDHEQAQPRDVGGVGSADREAFRQAVHQQDQEDHEREPHSGAAVPGHRGVRVPGDQLRDDEKGDPGEGAGDHGPGRPMTEPGLQQPDRRGDRHGPGCQAIEGGLPGGCPAAEPEDRNRTEPGRKSRRRRGQEQDEHRSRLSCRGMGALEEVPIPAMSPERFRSVLGDRYEQVEEAIGTAREVLSGRVIWHINSTAKGGGVAEMLHSLLAYARGAGVDVRWMTISGNPDFFQVTKRLHNRLHESVGDGGGLGAGEREIYEAALAEAADALFELVRPGDVVYIHDPQPAGLIPHIEAKDLKVIWRCHVGVDQPGELARGAWDFLRPYVRLSDAYVFSRQQFVWDGLDTDRVWLVAPSIAASSPKNRARERDAAPSLLAVPGTGGGAHSPAAFFPRSEATPACVGRAAELDQDEPISPGVPLISQVSR